MLLINFSTHNFTQYWSKCRMCWESQNLECILWSQYRHSQMLKKMFIAATSYIDLLLMSDRLNLFNFHTVGFYLITLKIDLDNTRTSVKFIWIVLVFSYGLFYSEKAILVLSITPGYLQPWAFWKWTAFISCFGRYTWMSLLWACASNSSSPSRVPYKWCHFLPLITLEYSYFLSSVLHDIVYVHWENGNTDLLFDIHIHGGSWDDSKKTQCQSYVKCSSPNSTNAEEYNILQQQQQQWNDTSEWRVSHIMWLENKRSPHILRKSRASIHCSKSSAMNRNSSTTCRMTGYQYCPIVVMHKSLYNLLTWRSFRIYRSCSRSRERYAGQKMIFNG